MPNLSPRNASTVRQGTATTQQLCEFASDLLTSHNYVAQQANASPIGQTPAAQAPTSMKATGGAGIVHISLGDASQAYRGNQYHIEIMPHGGNWATDAHPIHTGPARAFRGMMGTGKYVARACAGYSTSSPSPWIYSDVIDATGSAPPAFHSNPGSGVGSGGGFGNLPFSGNAPPKRQ